jgi:hypothetical protein
MLLWAKAREGRARITRSTARADVTARLLIIWFLLKAQQRRHTGKTDQEDGYLSRDVTEYVEYVLGGDEATRVTRAASS